MRGLGVYRGFDKSRKNGWYVAIAREGSTKSRPKAYFQSEKERDKAYDAKVREVRTVGLDAAAQISTADRHLLAEMKRLTPAGASPMEVFQRGLQQLGGISLRSLTFEQASKGLLEEQALRFAEKKISASRHKEIRTLIARFNGVFGDRPLSSINRTGIKTYLASLKVGPQTRMNIARNLSFIFNWFIAEGMVFQNPVPAQERVDRIPVVFTNEQVAELFETARECFPELIPMLAVQWYAALRPGASHHLRWEMVDFERRRILIEPHGNKLKQPDIVKDIPPTVFGWLSPFRQTSGLITPEKHIELNKALHHKLGYRGYNRRGLEVRRWPEDAARHTCLSNLTSLYEQDLKRVSDIALHTTSRTLLKHYLLKNIPKESAEAYFQSGLPRV